ncbi:MAG: hypothetical protein ACR2O4_05805 [Hyphomicrobiaceae bacterium]
MAEYTPPFIRDYFLEISKGNVAGHTAVNKFGRNTDVDTATVPEDIWDGGALWVAPTTARTHDVVSTDANDAAAGTGARTIRVYGLTGWSTAEVTEDITLNGTTNVPTVNSYVIIYRMQVMTVGSGGVNAGVITATAQTDATVTAQIVIGEGQTLMAIYGLPSTQNFYVYAWYLAANRAAASTAGADLELRVKLDADQSDSTFVVKHHLGLSTAGSSSIRHVFDPSFRVTGPAIIKVTAENVSANDLDISAGFDGVLVTK